MQDTVSFEIECHTERLGATKDLLALFDLEFGRAFVLAEVKDRIQGPKSADGAASKLTHFTERSACQRRPDRPQQPRSTGDTAVILPPGGSNIRRL
jgi:hypothetical protein